MNFSGKCDILSKSLYFNPAEFYIYEYSQISNLKLTSLVEHMRIRTTGIYNSLFNWNISLPKVFTPTYLKSKNEQDSDIYFKDVEQLVLNFQ
ncbi:hypothetical protein [Chryseobacterium indoltheticum]|uniref:hypothetical protein n=1 Tax=Chryseobacterium indoltheticum TaxID=254 RepID=UPI003F491D05